MFSKITLMILAFCALSLTNLSPIFGTTHDNELKYSLSVNSGLVIDGKFYVAPGSVYVAPNGIFVNINGNMISVPYLGVDLNGVYVGAEDAIGTCPVCGRITVYGFA